jgi:hypothetical protein
LSLFSFQSFKSINLINDKLIMRKLEKEILLFLLTQVIFVSLLFSAELSIESNPSEAQIYVSTDGKNEIEIGKSPYKQDLGLIIDKYIKKMGFVLIIKKEGHEPYRIFITKTSNVDITLLANLEISRTISNTKKQDRLISELFDIQRLIRSKAYQDAILKLTKLETEFKDISVIYELKATTYYIMKNMEQALAYYRKAFSTNSENIDAYKMKTYMEEKLKLGGEAK